MAKLAVNEKGLLMTGIYKRSLGLKCGIEQSPLVSAAWEPVVAL